MTPNFYSGTFKLKKEFLRKHDRFYPLDEQKLLFVAIPKNCSTSVRKATSNKAPIHLDQNKGRVSEYHKFCIIRNPITRFVSGYMETCKRRGKILGKTYHRFSNPLEKFKRFVDEITEEIFDIHVIEQAFFLQSFEIDYFLLFEKIEEDIHRVNQIFNKQLELQHQHRTAQRVLREELVKQIYSDSRLQSKVEKYLEDDLNLYSYVLGLRDSGSIS